MTHYDKDVDRPFPKGMNKKGISIFKDGLGRKIMTEFIALRPKTYSYLIDDDSEHKLAKGTKKCVLKRRLKLNDNKYCPFRNEIILKSQERCICIY